MQTYLNVLRAGKVYGLALLEHLERHHYVVRAESEGIPRQSVLLSSICLAGYSDIYVHTWTGD